MWNDLNPKMFLSRALQTGGKLEHEATRDGYGRGLVAAGKADKNVVVLCADLTESTRCLPFKQSFPDRFIQMGVSEQAMASIAAGLSLTDKIPFISSYAAFSPGRNWEQIRTTIALQNSNVKIAGGHAGLTVGEDGATHQMLEDIALMRVMPNMTVVVPCDSVEAQKATQAAAKTDGPVYLRFTRETSPVLTTNKTPFKIGRAETFREGEDVVIIAAGPLLYEALKAAEELERGGVHASVINCHTIKPLDTKTILKAARTTGAVVTVEEAQVAGGLGGAIAELLSASLPVPLERIGVQDRFGESGEPAQLLEAFGLTASHIREAALRAIARKSAGSNRPLPNLPCHPSHEATGWSAEAVAKAE